MVQGLYLKADRYLASAEIPYYFWTVIKKLAI
jgi:hypothetical protein